MQADIVCPSCNITRRVKDYRSNRTPLKCRKCLFEAHRFRGTCEQCAKEFVTKAGNVKRKGRGKFCTKSCYDEWQRRNRIHCKCEVCNGEFRITGHYRQRGRFCSMKCRDAALRRSHTEKSILAEQQGKLSIKQYRALAFENYPHRCARCGYDRHIKVLEVDHIDGNNKNHVIGNLQILCPTCHKEKTYAHLIKCEAA